MFKLTTTTSIIRTTDGASIPADERNIDYQAYLAWLAEGNTPEPADVPNPNDAIKAQIAQLESAQLMPRVTREFMLVQFAAVAQAQGVDPMTSIAYARLKEFDDQITALRNQLT